MYSIEGIFQSWFILHSGRKYAWNCALKCTGYHKKKAVKCITSNAIKKSECAEFSRGRIWGKGRKKGQQLKHKLKEQDNSKYVSIHSKFKQV